MIYLLTTKAIQVINYLKTKNIDSWSEEEQFVDYLQKHLTGDYIGYHNITPQEYQKAIDLGYVTQQ